MQSGEAEAIVIIKAAPQMSTRHGETVCCAGIDLHGNWLRLYPVAFRTLEQAKKFSRWDRIRFKWRTPTDDKRPESRRIDQDSLEIIGELKPSERRKFLSNLIVTSLNKEYEQGKSLALLSAEILQFNIEPRQKEEIAEEAEKYTRHDSQGDFFRKARIIPHRPCPYRFKYRYRTDDGAREGTCQDWEIPTTYFRWAERYGSDQALSDIQRVFGTDYPKSGMLLAMGTHSRYPDKWLINGVIRLDAITEPTLF